MWAPGAYKSAGRVTLPAPNIGIERYFFEVADTILSHIRSSRNTAILPQRTGPIADVLYSAAGNSADDSTTTAASSPTRSRPAPSASRSTRRRARSPARRSASSRASPGRHRRPGQHVGTVAAPNACWSTRATTRRWSSPRATSVRSRPRWSTTTTSRRRRRRSSTPPRRRAATRSTTSSTGSASPRSSTTRRTGQPGHRPDDPARRLADERCENRRDQVLQRPGPAHVRARC